MNQSPRHPIKKMEPLGSVLLSWLAPPTPRLYVFTPFLFCVRRLSSGVPIFPPFEGTETLLRVDGEPEEKSVLVRGLFSAVFCCWFLDSGWWLRGGEGPPRGVWLLKGDLCSTRLAWQHSCEGNSNKKKSLWLLPSNFWSPVTDLFLVSVASCRAAELTARVLQTDRLRVFGSPLDRTETCLTGASETFFPRQLFLALSCDPAKAEDTQKRTNFAVWLFKKKKKLHLDLHQLRSRFWMAETIEMPFFVHLRRHLHKNKGSNFQYFTWHKAANLVTRNKNNCC